MGMAYGNDLMIPSSADAVGNDAVGGKVSTPGNIACSGGGDSRYGLVWRVPVKEGFLVAPSEQLGAGFAVGIGVCTV